MKTRFNERWNRIQAKLWRRLHYVGQPPKFHHRNGRPKPWAWPLLVTARIASFPAVLLIALGLTVYHHFRARY